MKKNLVIGLIALSLAYISPSHAAGKVGVVDLQAVVNNSAYSQRLRDEITKELTPIGEELRSLSAKVAQMRQKLNKDGLTMGKAQRQKLEKEIRTKIFEAKIRESAFKEESQYREKEALDMVSKKALQAIETIAKEEGYDLILHNEVVLFAVEAIDVTDQVSKALK